MDRGCDEKERQDMSLNLFKDVSDINATRFADCPLSKLNEGKSFDKPISEYDKPLGEACENVKHCPVDNKLDGKKAEGKEFVPEVITRNSSLEGDHHPVTGVLFERKQVENVNGEKLEGVFPVFESLYDVQLPEDLYQETDNTQFSCCNQKLKEAFENGELDCSKFDERQLEQIANGDKPQGYTWHHSEELGKMELVKSDLHDKTGHTGGKVIWGGGQDAR